MAESFRKTTFIVMLFGMVTRLIAFLFKIYLSRAVGAEALGIYQIAMAVWALLSTLCGSGLAVTVSRKTAEEIALKRKGVGSTVSTSLIIGLLLTLAVSSVFIFGGEKVERLFSDFRAMPVFFVLLPSLVTTCVYNVLRSYVMGKKNYVLFSLTELIEEVLNVVAVLVLLSGVLGFFSGQMAIAIAFTLCDIICFFIILVIYFKQGGRFLKPRRFGEVLKSSTPVTMMRITNALSVSLTAIILPLKLGENGLSVGEATAEFGRATGMAYPLLFAPLAITSALSVVLLPEIASLNAKGGKEEISQKVDRSITLIILISIIFYLAYAIFGEDIGRILFSDEKAGQILSVSAGAILPMAISNFTTTVLNSMGKETTCFVNNTISILILLLAVFFLPKYLGIYALAVGQTACFTLIFILNAIALARAKVGKSAYLIPFSKCFAFALVCLALFRPLDLLLSRHLNPDLSALLLGIIMTIFYLLFLQLTKLLNIKSALSLLLRKIKKMRQQKRHV